MFELVLMAAVVVAIPALFLTLVRYGLRNDPGQAMPAWLLTPAWYFVAGAIGLFVLVAALNAPFHHGGEGALFFLIVALVVLGVFFHAWRNEFLFLMGRRDDEFPGRFDKLTWTLVLTLLAPVGLWFFQAYRLAHWPEPKAESTRIGGETASELS